MRHSDDGSFAATPASYSAPSRDADPVDSPNGTLRIVSANLWNGRADAESFAGLVGELGADVVLVQELGFRQAEALARVLPHGQLDPADDYTGLGIALRRPAEVWRLPLPCRDARVTEVEIRAASGTAESVEIINVHIQAPHLAFSPITYRQRWGQLRGIVRYLDATPRPRRAVLGDLNATPVWPVYRRLAARLNDAAVEWARRHGREPERTWGPWPSAPRLLRIDHAFVRGLVPRGFRTLRFAGADHSALVVDVAAE
jgi:endonuclease/exonuclease/phosphatase (EEP) superfamily protein YafD